MTYLALDINRKESRHWVEAEGSRCVAIGGRSLSHNTLDSMREKKDNNTLQC